MDRRDYPRFASHFVPRTTTGRRGLLLFLIFFALAEPPVLLLANRIEPFVLGMPFLYTYLLAVYIALIAVLLWIHHRDV
ncbi:MAG: hypothetical protein E2P02_20520 [Acidobacteria bacterium]|nr:MAG: hypothetical protein E2P02_20520 [Acidobacteriota bacterium]